MGPGSRTLPTLTPSTAGPTWRGLGTTLPSLCPSLHGASNVCPANASLFKTVCKFCDRLQPGSFLGLIAASVSGWSRGLCGLPTSQGASLWGRASQTSGTPHRSSPFRSPPGLTAQLCVHFHSFVLAQVGDDSRSHITEGTAKEQRWGTEDTKLKPWTCGYKWNLLRYVQGLAIGSI